jgi:hypothetical protein
LLVVPKQVYILAELMAGTLGLHIPCGVLVYLGLINGNLCCTPFLPESRALVGFAPAMCSVCCWTGLGRVLGEISPAAVAGLEFNWMSV